MVIANDHYQSIGIVRLSVIRGRSTCRTISFNFYMLVLCQKLHMFEHVADKFFSGDRPPSADPAPPPLANQNKDARTTLGCMTIEQHLLGSAQMVQRVYVLYT